MLVVIPVGAASPRGALSRLVCRSLPLVSSFVGAFPPEKRESEPPMGWVGEGTSGFLSLPSP
eukprot:10493866-Heterocapsa_arctica.AAC.1